MKTSVMTRLTFSILTGLACVFSSCASSSVKNPELAAHSGTRSPASEATGQQRLFKILSTAGTLKNCQITATETGNLPVLGNIPSPPTFRLDAKKSHPGYTQTEDGSWTVVGEPVIDYSKSSYGNSVSETFTANVLETNRIEPGMPSRLIVAHTGDGKITHLLVRKASSSLDGKGPSYATDFNCDR